MTDQNQTTLRVALGQLVHLTVPSFLEQHRYPGVVAVPVHDLEPSETVLLWRSSAEREVHRAFARAAEEVLAGTGDDSPDPDPDDR